MKRQEIFSNITQQWQRRQRLPPINTIPKSILILKKKGKKKKEQGNEIII